MLSFPPHSTHKVQPLDVGICGPFKAKLTTAFNDFMLSNPGKPITIYDVAKLSCEPYLISFTPSNGCSFNIRVASPMEIFYFEKQMSQR
jgi:hypothetical protein